MDAIIFSSISFVYHDSGQSSLKTVTSAPTFNHTVKLFVLFIPVLAFEYMVIFIWSRKLPRLRRGNVVEIASNWLLKLLRNLARTDLA